MNEQWKLGDRASFEVIGVDETESGTILSLKYNDVPGVTPIYINANDAVKERTLLPQN